MRERFAAQMFIRVCIAILVVLPAVAWCQEAGDQAEKAAVDKVDEKAAVRGEQISGAAQKLFPEGFMVAGRRAKLVRLPEDTRWFLMFEPAEPSDEKVAGAVEKQVAQPDPLSVPIGVLPGRCLTAMTAVTDGNVDLSVTFRVWGRITTYHKRNFILPTLAATLSYFGRDDGKAEAEQEPPTATHTKPAETTTVAEGQEESVANEFGLTKEVRAALLAVPRTTPLAVRSELQESQQTDEQRKQPQKDKSSGKAKTDKAWRDGDMVIDRVGRIAYDSADGRWLFVFEADGASMAEPPVTVHPSQLLEVMEQKVVNTSKLMRFRVSGQITNYRGGTYMLLHKVLMVYDLGNLHK